DERRVREVDDDVLAALPDHIEQLLLELGCGIEIDLARERDHVRAAVDLLGVDVEIHRSPGRGRAESTFCRRSGASAGRSAVSPSSRSGRTERAGRLSRTP